MILPDVNVLVYAHREDAVDHIEYRDWLNRAAQADEPLGLADVVLAGLIRVVTHPRVYDPPTPLDRALRAADALRAAPSAVPMVPGARHWVIFTRLSEAANATGNLVSDAYLAALAIETGCELITTDRDFARFPGLRWRHPLTR
ncbi:MAG: type II toxin-antitoxin system VapC family toxin [Solirubrobacterales bacterium]